MTDWERIETVLTDLIGSELVRDELMSRHTTLRVGGPAKWYWAAYNVDRLATVLSACWSESVPYLLIGHGSNLLMADHGFSGLIIQNRCKRADTPIANTNATVYSECGVSLGSLFAQSARAGLSGLEWGVGIPGTVGGALVSNAGAYRGNIGPLVRSVRVVEDGLDRTVGPEWMEFSYRDSKLRRAGIGKTVVLSCELELTFDGEPDAIMQRAKNYQELRKAKQPFYPSAGSFFKNILSQELAGSLPNLPSGMKDAGVVPAGYIIEAAGLKGTTVGGAQSSAKHANFLVNLGTATASDFHDLAAFIKNRVLEQYGVLLEEEVLYVGDWKIDQ